MKFEKKRKKIFFYRNQKQLTFLCFTLTFHLFENWKNIFVAFFVRIFYYKIKKEWEKKERKFYFKNDVFLR